MPRHRHLPLLLPLLLALACNSERGSREESVDYAEMPAEAPASAAPKPNPEGRFMNPGEGGQAAPAADAALPAQADTSAPDTAGAPARPVIPQMIIRTGNATLQVDSLEPAMARVEQLARRLGGYIANTSVQTGSHNVRQATLEMKLPAERWNQALGGLEPIGELEQQQTATEDVGEEFVDVTARVANARRLEARLLELLGTRTGRLEDVLAVERELARVREQIERFEGRLRYLRTRVAVSTLTVVLHEPSPVLAPGRSPIVDAFRQAWRNFVGFTAGLIASLGWLIPLLLVVAAVVWILRRLLGRRGPGTGPRFAPWRRGAPPAPPASPPPPSGPMQPPQP